ncbi:hypothetical protein [Streptomyces nodosus]|nr:hypothetical protein [Streptomyces nodosus]MBB4795664.1 hypothetical protein [Streptomyces nodosus]
MKRAAMTTTPGSVAARWETSRLLDTCPHGRDNSAGAELPGGTDDLQE